MNKIARSDPGRIRPSHLHARQIAINRNSRQPRFRHRPGIHADAAACVDGRAADRGESRGSVPRGSLA
ncbi:MAG: hypothetical protein AAFU70_07625, partial [Planctomycetota bacterium]